MLVRRNPKKYPEIGPKWDIVGGRIIPGTRLKDNLRREIKEETGLDYPGQPRLVAAQDILKSAEKHVVRLTFVGQLEGQPAIDEESLEARWFSPAEIRQLKPQDLDPYFSDLLTSKALTL